MSVPEEQDRQEPAVIAEAVVKRLEQAWNSGDGAAYAEPFTADADFVTIRGEHHSGREAIGHGHQGVFDSIYAGSRVRYEVEQARELDGGAILAHAKGALEVPSGPLAGEHAALASMVLVKRGDRHEIAAFHNTLIAA